MQFRNFIAPGIAFLISTSAIAAPCHQVDITPEWRGKIVKNWLTLWAGDYSFLNKTVTPDVRLFQDRFPTGNGSVSLPIDSADALLGFVQSARTSFEKYRFKDDMHFGKDNNIALRWTLDAVYAGAKGSTLKAGSHVAYNGTDIMILDRCTGLISEVLSAQDLITYFHVLGQPVGVV